MNDGDLYLELKNIVPIHDQLVAYFTEEIDSRRLIPGDRMPSENALARRFGISRMTVRRAFDTLVHAGLLVRQQGKGTFVAEFSRKADTGLIGFIGQTLTTGISSEMVAHLNRAIEDRGLRGWHLLVCGAQNDPEKQLHYVETLQNHRVRGIILAPAVLESYDRNVKTVMALRQAGLPFVLIERYVEQVDCDYVVSDNFKAGYIATRHLIGLGHKRIAFIDGAGVPSIRQRKEGYRTALEENDLLYDPGLVLYSPDHTVRLDEEQIEAVLKKGATAVFAYADYGAMEVINWCLSRGIRVPEDVAVVGVGDVRVALGPRPILTTVQQDLETMANRALGILLGRIGGRMNGHVRQHEILDVRLVVRKSCGAKGITHQTTSEEMRVI
jgi:GntR family transcriptional regulator of arabinose operon